MFLKPNKKYYKGKEYITYTLTESYREDGKVKHRNISNLGTLTVEQADRIRLVLKAKQAKDVLVAQWPDVVVKKHFRYLDVMVLDYFWQQWGLNGFFKDVPYAEAMVVNRCLEPKSKIKVHSWVQKTVLPRLVSIGSEDSEYAVYQALDKIANMEGELQSYLYDILKQKGKDVEKTIFYDITSSYFEGTKCILSTYGYSRDKRSDKEQITIALVITPDGYPIYWRVMPGNTQDITTVENLLSELEERFKIKECLLVFDRGMVSEDNLKAIHNQGLTYISALDKDEIRGLGLMEDNFPELVKGDKWKEKLEEAGFLTYDDNLLYREHNKNNNRYILSFGKQLYTDNQVNRQERLSKALSFLEETNNELAQAKKSRDISTTALKIDTQLRRLRMHKAIEYTLNPMVIDLVTSKGKERQVNTFSIIHTVQEDILRKQGFLDGITCFITNQATDKVSSRDVIYNYRRKNKVEEAFREIKGHLSLRPFYLHRDKRIQAHVSICVLGYFLLTAINEILLVQKEKFSPAIVLEHLGECQLNRIGLRKETAYVESITDFTKEQLDLLKVLSCEHLVSSKYLTHILEHSAV